MRKLLQRWHGVMAIYHRWALGRHCSYLPSWWIVQELGGELEQPDIDADPGARD